MNYFYYFIGAIAIIANGLLFIFAYNNWKRSKPEPNQEVEKMVQEDRKNEVIF
jgi:hypothetical protein